MKPDWVLSCSLSPTQPESRGVVGSPGFDEGLALKMRNSDVRTRFPRLVGPCPKGCGVNGTFYASAAHYIFGGSSDWNSD